MSLNVGSLVAYLDLNDENFDRKTKAANKQIDGLALHLEALKKIKPDLDLKVTAKTEELDRLKARLVELKAQAADGADVRVDVAEAMFKLAAVRAEIRDLNRDAMTAFDPKTTNIDNFAKSLDNVGGKMKALKVPGGLVASALALSGTLVPVGNAAIGVLGGVATSAVEAAGAVGILSLAFKGAGGAVTAYQNYQTALMKATTAKQRNAAANTLNASAYGQASASTQAFARFDINQLHPFGASLASAAQAGVLPGLTSGLRAVLHDAPQLRTAIGDISKAVGGLFTTAGHALNSPFWKQWIVFFGRDSAANVKVMGNTLGNLFEGIARAMERSSPQTHSLLTDVDNLAIRFNKWTASSNFEKFLTQVSADGHQVSGILHTLGEDLKPLIQGLGQSGRTELSVIGDFLSGISKLPTSWLVAAGKYLPLIFLATKVGGAGINGLGSGLQLLSKGLGSASGLLSKAGIVSESRLGGFVGKISQATATPVYVTNWPGGGIPGLPGTSNPDAKTPRIPPVISNALPKVIKFGGAVAALYTILPGSGGDSGQPLNANGIRLEQLYKAVGSDSFGHGFHNKISDLIQSDTIRATAILTQFAKDTNSTLAQVVARFDLAPAFARAVVEAKASAATIASLLNFTAHVSINTNVTPSGSILSNILGPPPSSKKPGHNALGTNFWQGGLTRIDEQGGELIDLPRGSRVYSHARSEQMLAASKPTQTGPVHLSESSIDRLAKAIVTNTRSMVGSEIDQQLVFMGG